MFLRNKPNYDKQWFYLSIIQFLYNLAVLLLNVTNHNEFCLSIATKKFVSN